MHVVTRDAEEIAAGADVNGDVAAEGFERRLECPVCRFAQQHRLDGVAAFGDQPLDDQPSFGDKLAALPQSFRVRHRLVRAHTRVAGSADAQNLHRLPIRSRAPDA